MLLACAAAAVTATPASATLLPGPCVSPTHTHTTRTHHKGRKSNYLQTLNHTPGATPVCIAGKTRNRRPNTATVICPSSSPPSQSSHRRSHCRYPSLASPDQAVASFASPPRRHRQRHRRSHLTRISPVAHCASLRRTLDAHIARVWCHIRSSQRPLPRRTRFTPPSSFARARWCITKVITMTLFWSIASLCLLFARSPR